MMTALIPRMASALSTNAKQNGHTHSSDLELAKSRRYAQSGGLNRQRRFYGVCVCGM